MNKITLPFALAILICLHLLSAPVHAQVPGLINYQGRVAVSGTNFEGTAQFKFALVDTTGTTTYWSNDGSSSAGSEPGTAVTLTVTKGLYSVLLGDTTLTHMTTIPATVFTNPDVRLRVWFNDGPHFSQLLTPDQRIAAVGYAMVANAVANGSVGSSQLAPNLTLAGTVGLTGDINLPVTASASTGVLEIGGTPFLHAYSPSGLNAGNNFVGTNAGNFTMTGNANTATGANALQSNTTGDHNTANGMNALQLNQSGIWNTAVGVSALQQNTQGSWNTAIGVIALQLNQSGIWNTAVGASALQQNTSGASNTAIGGNALYYNTTGGSNTALGGGALYYNAGTNNIGIGNNGGAYLTTGNNNIDIGNGGVAGESNIIRIGDGITQTDTYLTGTIHGNGTGVTGVPGTITWQTVSGTSQQAQPNNGYIVTSSTQLTITLPASPNVGDVVRVSGVGAGGWKIAQNGSQYIFTPILAGMVWTPTGISAPWVSIASSTDGTKLVAAAYGGQLYTSSDSGATWTARDSNRNWEAVASSGDGSKLVAVAQADQIYTSTDSGATWTPRGITATWRSAASSMDGTKLVAVGINNQIYTSTNSGINWTARASSQLWERVASSSDGVKLVAVVKGGQIYTSSDSGATWTAHANSQMWQSLASSADGTKLAAGVDGGQIYTSTDSGVTWTPNGPSLNFYTLACSGDGSTLVAAGTPSQIYISTDSGSTWTARDSQRYWMGAACSADGTKLAIVVGNGGQIYISTSMTTSGASGYVTGGQGSAIELQYVGNGEFMAISYAGKILGN